MRALLIPLFTLSTTSDLSNSAIAEMIVTKRRPIASPVATPSLRLTNSISRLSSSSTICKKFLVLLAMRSNAATSRTDTDAELNRRGDFLKSWKDGRPMNVEALDGFYAALIAGQEPVMPSEYY